MARTKKTAAKTAAPKSVETFTHPSDKRKNIPTAEHETVMTPEEKAPKPLRYPRNTDLDPQLVWRGKDEQDWSDLVVHAPPLYIQEKVHPKALIDDLLNQTKQAAAREANFQTELFSDFNGIPDGVDKTEFYRHDQNWSNRMILGDSLQVMASLAEREGLRGKVQCIYLDPPYGIKFNSNFQWSTTSRDVKDGKADHITREPEQVKAFRDTWRDGIHSYLTYLRDRLTVARDLLTDSGSIFIQIGDENVHRVKSVMDEVFGEDNFIANIVCLKTSGQASKYLSGICDYVLLYGKDSSKTKYRSLYRGKVLGEPGTTQYVWLREDQFAERRLTQDDAAPDEAKVFAADNLSGQGIAKEPTPFEYEGITFYPGTASHWKPNYPVGMARLAKAQRLKPIGKSLMYRRYLFDFNVTPISNIWNDVLATGLTEQKIYVVQTSQRIVERCLLLATDPGDLVLDPTCGSGTTAFVAEQWGRRWITIDTSRVALALARARIMGARYPYYLLADSREGQQKEAEVTRTVPSSRPVYGNIRHGFVYERVPHITLKSIANNAEIDVIWEKWQQTLGPISEELSVVSGQKKPLEEWEIPRQPPPHWPPATHALLAAWWQARIARQQEIDKSIAAKAEFEYLYDKPYENKKSVRVAGPFTVESLSPHRMLGVDENDELMDPFKIGDREPDYLPGPSFEQMILENLRAAGVQQAHKEDRITFTTLTPWPGAMVCAEGRYQEGETERRAAIMIGPEFGTVQRADLVEAAREAADGGFDVLIACAFNYEAHATEFSKLGRIAVLKARMNADLHMAADLKSTGKGNLFVIFGEPDVTVASSQWLVNRNGNPIASYEHGKALSGLGSLEEINRAGRAGLSVVGKVSGGDHGSTGTGGSRWTNAQRAQTLAALQNLTEADFPLSLTTDHWLQVTLHGVDVFDPSTGEVRSDSASGIACWFLDTDYNAESFFVRHAYFLGQSDPYKSLKTTLKAEINEEAWATLNSDTSRPFSKPASGRIAVKVINHLGDEVMKVFKV